MGCDWQGLSQHNPTLMLIRLSTTLRWPLARQIPADWEKLGIKVVINEPVPECDLWVVYQGLRRPETCRVPEGRKVFFSYEPPGLHHYNSRFLEQFDHVVTCHEAISHPGRILRQQSQPWLAGVVRHATDNVHEGLGARFSWEDFSTMTPPHKTRTISAVCSKKIMVPGHTERLDLLERVQAATPIDVFGYGFEPIADKWDALAPYSYHLVLENTCVPHYWSEKVADAFLAWCVPVGWGCPNLAEYFPEKAFVMLDPEDVEGSVALLRATITSVPSAEKMEAVCEARRRVLEDFNLMAVARKFAEMLTRGPLREVALRDERLFHPFGPARRALGRLVGK